ncbi:MAG: putative nitroreductase YodC [Pseudomonadota bacterium]|jgi:nitroreductase
MNTEEAICSRRSVKYYDPNHQMTAAEIEQLLSLTILSPTAFNIQHWRLVLIEDQALRLQLKQAAWGQAQVSDASLLVVICADVKAWEKNPQRYWRNTADTVQATILPMIDQYYRGRDQTQRDEALRSCGMAAQTLMLAAKSMGYDSCPMTGFNFDQVAKLINLPEDHLIAMLVAIGKPLKPAQPKPGQLALNEIVFRDHF